MLIWKEAKMSVSIESPTVDIGTMIVRTPGTCGGRPRINGTRITVKNIVVDHLHGESPEEILSHYPHLTVAQVHGALAYYYANRETMDAAFRREGEEAAALEARAMRERKMKT